MVVKVNFVLEDDVKKDLDRLVKSGLRSRVINEALRKELLQIKRRKLAEQHDRLRSRTKALSTTDIVGTLRRDRSRS
jgi:Arc/MetJ-type ribon-helix-helix transcriptional regulator